jgi:cyclophilin family peptidyl-prolyl cis-trans isomerase
VTISRIAVVLLATLAFATNARCAETADKTFAELRAEAETAKIEFRKRLDALQKAKPDERRAMMLPYREQVDKIRSLAAALEQAGLAEYRRHPNQDQDLVEWMVIHLKDLINRDDYETAAEIATLLVKNKFDLRIQVVGGVTLPDGKHDTVLTPRAGMSFFGANDFDNARLYLERAQESGSLGMDDLQLGMGGPQGVITMDALAVKPTEELEWAGRYRALWANEQKRRKAEGTADDLPIVRLSTSKGDITLQLFENDAPNTTANFIDLVENKFYDGCDFQDVISGLGAQAGRQSASGVSPDFTIPAETDNPDHRVHFRGSLSMVTPDDSKASSEFRIAFLANRKLDDKNTVFGRVTEGFDVLVKLQRIDSAYPTPKNVVLDKIVSAKVLRKRTHPYVPRRHEGGNGKGSDAAKAPDDSR